MVLISSGMDVVWRVTIFISVLWYWLAIVEDPIWKSWSEKGSKQHDVNSFYVEYEPKNATRHFLHFFVNVDDVNNEFRIGSFD